MEDMLRLNFFILAGLLTLGAVWWVLERALLAVGALRPAQPAQEPAQPQPTPAHAAQPRASIAAPPDYGAWAAAHAAPSLDWLREINDLPHVAPHIAAVGPSRSGKSTLILAALTRRPGHLVITTPKSAADDGWGGFPAVRSTFDANYVPSYTAIGAAWQAVYLEMNRRHADGSRPRVPLTLVVDEFTTCLHELRGIEPQQLFIRMWLMGASVGVRLVTMDPTMNVKGWGIEGRGDVRESILFVRTERDKSARFFEWDAQRHRAFNERPFDTAQVPALAAHGLDPSRVWMPDALPAAQVGAQPAQALRDAARFHAPTAPEPTPHEAALVRRWHEEGDTGLRSLARRLYHARGGDDPAYTGDGGPFYAVKAALAAGVVAETLSA